MTDNKKQEKKIIVAEKAGFCFGVRRAVEMAREAIRKSPGPIFCLGEIIHNPRVIKELEEKGMKTVSGLAEVPDGATVIVRSHGVPPQIFSEAKRRGIKIIDATCPFVASAQKKAAGFSKDGRQVIIFGDPNHAEVIGIKGYAPEAMVVENEKGAENFGEFRDVRVGKIGILAQTTQKPDIFQKIIDRVKEMTPEVEVANTICLDSFDKKQEVKKMAGTVDVMIVVGGKKSNNTKKLADVSAETGAKTFCVESAKELKKEWLSGAEKIGVAAGASTPDESIEEVVDFLGRF